MYGRRRNLVVNGRQYVFDNLLDFVLFSVLSLPLYRLFRDFMQWISLWYSLLFLSQSYFVKVHFEKAIPEIAFDFRIIPNVSVLFPDQFHPCQYGIKPALNSSAKKAKGNRVPTKQLVRKQERRA